ncbi:hypothetical protein C8A03DRAFT_16679 [Achaetomium macrosporum]|uniref:Uncharacterized protein n=1 Tax=Achaetomium macrosporum TaxID=79813 RepID=A0AAN7C7M1_9PEZI|nr:hypothetical protein C8A03DRAFT_16679 [Achaetomium macrosporum]
MLVPKRPAIRLLLLQRPSTLRCLSTTAFRASPATPQRDRPSYGPNDPRGGNPVDDIDVVFDFPSEGQASYQKRSLEDSGLDIHSAMPHHPSQHMKGKGMGKDMAEGNVMYRYIGLGALGLGGLYMVMRRRGGAKAA